MFYFLLSMALVAFLVWSIRPRTIQLAAPFVADDAIRLIAKGENTITGKAFIRKANGIEVPCANQVVTLVPATAYANERMAALFHNPGRDFRSDNALPRLKFVPDVHEFHVMVRKTTADSQGRFTFGCVADGCFYLVTQVSYTASAGNSVRLGGKLIIRVEVEEGETKDVLLSH